MLIGGRSLHRHQSYRFSLTPRRGGRLGGGGLAARFESRETRMETQQLGGSVLTFYSPSGVLQDLKDMFSFHIDKLNYRLHYDIQ